MTERWITSACLAWGREKMAGYRDPEQDMGPLRLGTGCISSGVKGPMGMQ